MNDARESGNYRYSKPSDTSGPDLTQRDGGHDWRANGYDCRTPAERERDALAALTARIVALEAERAAARVEFAKLVDRLQVILASWENANA